MPNANLRGCLAVHGLHQSTPCWRGLASFCRSMRGDYDGNVSIKRLLDSVKAWRDCEMCDHQHRLNAKSSVTTMMMDAWAVISITLHRRLILRHCVLQCSCCPQSQTRHHDKVCAVRV